jgi:hypothetical protein
LHQRTKGRDDERQPPGAKASDERWSLEEDRLAATGWKADQYVVAVGHDGSGRRLLTWPELDAELLLKRLDVRRRIRRPTTAE